MGIGRKIKKIIFAIWNKLMYEPIDERDIQGLIYEGYKLGRDGWEMTEWANDIMVFTNPKTGEVHEFHEG